MSRDTIRTWLLLWIGFTLGQVVQFYIDHRNNPPRPLRYERALQEGTGDYEDPKTAKNPR